MGEQIRWWYDDPAHDLLGVRLEQHAGLAPRSDQSSLDFVAAEGGWLLEVPRPAIDRIEYRLTLRHRDGSVASVEDPGNPLRAVGVFGQPSVLELPGYQPPWWLDVEPEREWAAEWERIELVARGRGLRDVPVTLCQPLGVEPAEPLPLLLAHDGGEMDALGLLTRYAAVTVAAGKAPAYRIALLSPLDRDNWYSGSHRYGRTLATSVLPMLRYSVNVAGPAVGYGASLGALSMLATELAFPGTFGGLGLASGSFFHPGDDPQESGFRRYWRIIDRVTDVLDGAMATTAPARSGLPPLRVGMACGTVEENLANNRRMARALEDSGHLVGFHEFRDAHNFTAWRDALDQQLTPVLADLWG